MAELLFDFRRRADGSSDFFADESAMALSQAMEGGLNGALGRAQARGNLGIAGVVRRSGQERLQLFVGRGLAGSGAFLAEPGQRLIEQCKRPATLEELVRGGFVHRLQVIAFFGRLRVEGNERLTAAAFECGGFVVFVGEEVLEGAEQVKSEFTLLAIGEGEVPLLNQASEKSLSQVLCVMGVATAAAEVGVERIPVGLAQF